MSLEFGRAAWRVGAVGGVLCIGAGAIWLQGENKSNRLDPVAPDGHTVVDPQVGLSALPAERAQQVQQPSDSGTCTLPQLDAVAQRAYLDLAGKYDRELVEDALLDGRVTGLGGNAFEKCSVDGEGFPVYIDGFEKGIEGVRIELGMGGSGREEAVPEATEVAPDVAAPVSSGETEPSTEAVEPTGDPTFVGGDGEGGSASLLPVIKTSPIPKPLPNSSCSKP